MVLKFEKKPIVPNPTCAICGKPVKNHSNQDIKTCMEERRRASLAIKKNKDLKF